MPHTPVPPPLPTEHADERDNSRRTGEPPIAGSSLARTLPARIRETVAAAWKVLCLWTRQCDLTYRRLPQAYTKLGRHVAEQPWAREVWEERLADMDRTLESRMRLEAEPAVAERSPLATLRRTMSRFVVQAQRWSMETTIRRMQRELGQVAFEQFAAESGPTPVVNEVSALRQQKQEVTNQLASLANAQARFKPQWLAASAVLLSLCGCLAVAGRAVQGLTGTTPLQAIAAAPTGGWNSNSQTGAPGAAEGAHAGVGAAANQEVGPWDAYSMIPKREQGRLHPLQREWLDFADRSFAAIRKFNAEGTNKLTRDRLKREAYAKQDRECQQLKAKIRNAGIDNWRMVLTDEGLMFAPGTVAYPVGLNMFEHHQAYSLTCFIAEQGSVDIFTAQLAHMNALHELNPQAAETLSKVREGESVYVSLPPRSFSIEQFTGMEAFNLAMMDGGSSEASNYINKIAMCVYPEGVPYVQCYTTHLLKVDDVSQLQISLKPRNNDYVSNSTFP